MTTDCYWSSTSCCIFRWQSWATIITLTHTLRNFVRFYYYDSLIKYKNEWSECDANWKSMDRRVTISLANMKNGSFVPPVLAIATWSHAKPTEIVLKSWAFHFWTPSVFPQPHTAFRTFPHIFYKSEKNKSLPLLHCKAYSHGRVADIWIRLADGSWCIRV